MEVQVTKTKVIIDKKIVANRGEYNINNCEFVLDEVYNDLINVAVFTKGNASYEINIEDNKCTTPYDVLQEEGIVELGVYGYKEENGELVLRYSPKPDNFNVTKGSYIEDTQDPSKPDTSRYLLPDNIKAGENIFIEKEGKDLTIISTGGGTGSNNYHYAINKPQINGVELDGNKTSEELNIKELSTEDKEKLDSLVNYDDTEIREELENKQDTLVSGTNIKTINNKSLLGEGNIVIEGGGDAVLQSDLIVSNPIGKYTMEEKIDEGTMLETIFRGILSKTYYPTLTDPSASLSYSSNALYKVGASIEAKSATLTFNRGSINPQYTADSPYRAGEATSYKLTITGASEGFDKTQNNGTFAIPVLTRATKGNIVLSGQVNYAQGVQPKDSDGANYKQPLPAGNKTASKTIEFILPFYYGVSNSTDISALTGFTEDLSRKGNKTYYFNASNQHLVLIFDSSYGNLKSIIDANNFDLIDGWTKTTKTIDGQSYNVYVSNKKNTDTNIKLTFNF